MGTEPPVVPTLSPSMAPSDGMMSMPSDGMMSMDMEFDLDDMIDDEFGRAGGKKSKKMFVSDKVSVSAICFIKSVLNLGLIPHSSLFLISYRHTTDPEAKSTQGIDGWKEGRQGCPEGGFQRHKYLYEN
jgi:hypothetical protein